MNEQYHPIQRQILNRLLFSSKLNFASLKPFDMEGSQFTFHLTKLIELELINKDSDGKYSLTPKGKNIANAYDTDSNLPNKQAKLSVVFCATKNDQSEFLIYTRLKNPFYGCQGFPTGKVKYGENIVDTAKREFSEETNLTGEAQLRGIRHFKVYDKNSKQLLEDKVMYIFEIKEPFGELKSNDEGKFKWIKAEDISAIENALEEFEETFQVITNFTGEITFKEIDQYTSKF